MRWSVVGWVAVSVACGSTAQTSDGSGDGSSEGGGSSDEGTMEWPAPDCATLMLPGNPDDVAATPRPDRDAEVLALQIEPALFVARQDRYDVIAADLAAIREADPSLADVHIECDLPQGYGFWVWTEVDYFFMDAIFRDTFEGWACHNAFYGIDDEDTWMLDGRGFAMRVDGVYASAFTDLYLALPGFEDFDAEPYWGDNPIGDATCELGAGRISLEATEDDTGALVERTYTMEHPQLGESTWVATGSGAPVPAG